MEKVGEFEIFQKVNGHRSILKSMNLQKLFSVWLTLNTLGKNFSRRHFEFFFFFFFFFFFIFPGKQDLVFHANCLQWRQFS